MGTPQLSTYEQMRLEKIERNEKRLKELGIFKYTEKSNKKRENKKVKKDSKTSSSFSEPTRRSSRKRKAVVDYSEERVHSSVYEKDEGDDGEYSSDLEEEVDGG